MDVSNISIISRGDMYKDVRVRNSRDRHRNQRDKDVEANYSETEDSREDVDKFDSSSKNVVRSKRLAYFNYNIFLWRKYSFNFFLFSIKLIYIIN